MGTFVAVAGAGVLLSVQSASADTTPVQTATVDLGDLDGGGSGIFDAFDPALGTLTQVDLTAETDMTFQVCVHNRSAESDSIPSGSATGESPIVFPADVISNATGSMGIPATDLGASDGGDDCTAWLEGGAAPSSADSVLFETTDVSPFSETLTDPADLAEYIGPGDIEFTYSSMSDSSIGQPSEWTIVFLATGTAEVSIQYTYTAGPAATTTTTTSPTTTTVCVPPTTTTLPGGSTSTTVDPCAPPASATTTTVCVPSGATTTTGVGGSTVAPPPTCAPGQLPRTGNDGTAPLLAVGAILLAAGSGLVITARRRSH